MSPIGWRILLWLNQSTYSRIFEGGVFEMVEVPPWSFLSDEFGLVQSDNGFGEGIVVGVAY